MRAHQGKSGKTQNGRQGRRNVLTSTVLPLQCGYCRFWSGAISSRYTEPALVPTIIDANIMPKKVVSVTATRYDIKKIDVKVASTQPSSEAIGASDGPAEITDIAEKALPLQQGATPAPLVPPKKAPSKKATGKRAPAKKATGEGKKKKKKRSTKVGLDPVYRNNPAGETSALPRLSAFPTCP